MRFVCLQRPLLGPPAWRPLAEVQGGFHRTLAADLEQSVDAAGANPVTPVAHSGADPLVPVLAAALSPPVAGTILVNAILPHPGLCWLDTEPDGV